MHDARKARPRHSPSGHDQRSLSRRSRCDLGHEFDSDQDVSGTHGTQCLEHGAAYFGRVDVVNGLRDQNAKPVALLTDLPGLCIEAIQNVDENFGIDSYCVTAVACKQSQGIVAASIDRLDQPKWSRA